MHHHVLEGLEAAIVHVRRGHGDVAQGGGLEGADLVNSIGHGKATQLGGLFIRQHGLVHVHTLRLGLEELTCQAGYVLLYPVDADADVMEAIVGKQRLILFDDMAGYATPLTQEYL